MLTVDMIVRSLKMDAACGASRDCICDASRDCKCGARREPSALDPGDGELPLRRDAGLVGLE